MEKSIFQLASEYNFDAVFDYHNSGNSINICDEDGNSLFATFLSGYACYGDIVEDEEELLKLDLDETDGWMECEKCHNAVQVMKYVKTRRVPVYQLKDCQILVPLPRK